MLLIASESAPDSMVSAAIIVIAASLPEIYASRELASSKGYFVGDKNFVHDSDTLLSKWPAMTATIL